MRKRILSLLNMALGPAGFACMRGKDRARETARAKILLDLLWYHQARPPARRPGAPLVEGIVFSRDRACQLHGLLTSYFDQVKPAAPLRILFSASDERHFGSYAALRACFSQPEICWVQERQFRPDLLSVLREVQSRWVFFLVDDIVFIRPVDFGFLEKLSPGEVVPSLRMGEHLTCCYTKDKPMSPPPFFPPAAGLDGLAWNWDEGDLDWGYPLSVDGHLFDPEEIRRIAEGSAFSRPNSFERALQLAAPAFCARKGFSFRESRLVNLPVNRVQSEKENIHGTIHQSFLLEKWEQGLRIDVQKLYGMHNRSVHQELAVAFAPRDGADGAPESRRTV